MFVFILDAAASLFISPREKEMIYHAGHKCKLYGEQIIIVFWPDNFSVTNEKFNLGVFNTVD
jgi:hypothetical protein